jgi:hypothetical protein
LSNKMFSIGKFHQSTFTVVELIPLHNPESFGPARARVEGSLPIDIGAFFPNEPAIRLNRVDSAAQPC